MFTEPAASSYGNMVFFVIDFLTHILFKNVLLHFQEAGGCSSYFYWTN